MYIYSYRKISRRFKAYSKRVIQSVDSIPLHYLMGLLFVVAVIVSSGIYYMQSSPSKVLAQSKRSGTNCLEESSGCSLNQPSSTQASSGQSSAASSSPTPTATPTPTPAPVPQTALNNVELNAQCADVQNTYDTAAVKTENATWTAIQGAEALESSEPLSQVTAQENQIYTAANAALNQEYSPYLAAVHAIPGCAVDFQLDLYPLMP